MNFETQYPGLNPQKIYQEYKFWFTTQGTGAGNFKMLFNVGTAGPNFAPAIFCYSSAGAWQCSLSIESNQIAYQKGMDLHPSYGAWHTLRLQGKQSSGGGALDGSVQIWLDNFLEYNQVGIKTRDNAANSWKANTFFHGVTNMDAPSQIYIDDVYLNDSWARAVVSDSATFSPGMTQVIQRPVTWENGSVKVVLNRGAFADFSNLYLYIIDNDGNANVSGFKLNGVVAPKSPSGVTVQ